MPAASESADYIAISRLQARYADVVNRRAWNEFRELFVVGAPVTVDTRTTLPFELAGPDELGAFIGERISDFDFFEFVILNTVVDIDGEQARARLFMCELRHGASGFSIAYGVYHDDYTKLDGRWWFARRRYHSLARATPDFVSFPFPVLPPG